jgi:phage terminase large subunit-like protein
VTALSAEMASVVGLNPSLAVVDELHLLGGSPKGAALVNQIRTGSVARREPLLISISTAPTDRSAGIFDATLRKAKRVISGEEIDPRFAAWLCEIPEALDPEDPENWHWSNPSLKYTVTRERLEADLQSARSDPTALRDFLSQNLNVAPELSMGTDRWLSLAEWDACADDTLSLEALLQESRWVYIGIDRGGLDDLSALDVLGRTTGGKYLLWSHQWLSHRGYEKRKSVNPYHEFIAADELTIFEGGIGDLLGITQAVKMVADTGKLSMIGIDSFGAPGLVEALSPLGAEISAVAQNYTLTPAIAQVPRLIAEGALKHSGSRLLRWNIGNSVVTRHGNSFHLSKATAVGAAKVDGAAALLNAVAVCLARAEEDQPLVYESRGILFI